MRGHDYHIGAMGVSMGQSSVVTSDLADASLPVRQEVDIVNGHHPSRAPGGHHERRRRMDDVEWSRGQEFNGRPFMPMPQPVQVLHGHPAIHPSDSGRQCRGQTILPGTAENREVRAGRAKPGQSVHEAGDPEPRARPVPESGAVVDKNPHDLRGWVRAATDRSPVDGKQVPANLWGIVAQGACTVSRVMVGAVRQ